MLCLLYTSDAADDMQCVDLGGRRIIKKVSIGVSLCFSNTCVCTTCSSINLTLINISLTKRAQFA